MKGSFKKFHKGITEKREKGSREEDIAEKNLLAKSRKEVAKLYTRRESNPYLRYRKPPFYPLNYRCV